MKAMCINEKKEFVWTEVPDPVCHAEFDVKIKIRAAALNRADLMQRAGIYAPPEGWPLWPGLECAGEVMECPEGGRFRVGDRVCALLGGGGYAEEVVVPEGMCMPIPKGFEFWEAAGIPEVYATAYLNLRIVGEIQRGETFFINGARADSALRRRSSRSTSSGRRSSPRSRRTRTASSAVASARTSPSTASRTIS